MEHFKSFKTFLGLLVYFIVGFELVNSCTISAGWTSLQMNERLLLSDIVVYGKTTQHVANVKRINDRSYTFIDAVFEVYCVLKPGEDPVAEQIVIEGISPRDGCSGTRGNMQIQEEAIVALRRTSEGTYKYHEVLPTTSATFTPSRAAFYSIGGMCDLQRWTPPQGATQNRCPVCGSSNFTQDAMDADLTAAAPCTLDSNFGAESEDCEMYVSQSYSNSSICLPTSYTSTCIRLSVTAPTAECVCNDIKHTQNAFLDVGEGSITKPSVMATLCTVLLTVLSVMV